MDIHRVYRALGAGFRARPDAALRARVPPDCAERAILDVGGTRAHGTWSRRARASRC
jgi:hypothetical protein